MSSKNDPETVNADEKTPSSLAHIFIANFIVGVVFFVLVSRLPPFINCFDPMAQNLIITFFLILTLHYFSSAVGSLNLGPFAITAKPFFEIIGSRTLLQKRWMVSVVIFILLVLIVLYLGSYAYSPIYARQGRIPMLRGIVVTTGGSSGSFQSGQAIQIKSTSFVSLKASVEPTDSKCSWSSSYGGTFDNPDKCETAYIPPLGATMDLLQISIKSACQFQQTDGHLQIAIQP